MKTIKVPPSCAHWPERIDKRITMNCELVGTKQMLYTSGHYETTFLEVLKNAVTPIVITADNINFY
jgi:hypothetical protein